MYTGNINRYFINCVVRGILVVREAKVRKKLIILFLIKEEHCIDELYNVADFATEIR